MTLTLQNISYSLADGRVLFNDLNAHFDSRHTGLVGRNGIGKSVLARIMAGELQPSHGQCQHSGTVWYMAQQTRTPDGTLATLTGLKPILDALDRIEAGGVNPDDFDLVQDHWDIRERLSHDLARIGLAGLTPDTPAHTLSGGEITRLTLLGAMLREPDFLILDEPTNHLDRHNRLALLDQLQSWTRGLLVISHDRELLNTMQRIAELSSLGLTFYGGNYDFYAEAKAQERESALRQLEHHKTEQKRQEAAMQQQRERLDRRQARGKKQGQQANQAPILLGLQKSRSEHSAGAIRAQHAETREALSQKVRDAARRLKTEADIFLHLIHVELGRQRQVADIDARLPFCDAHVQLILTGPQRIALTGPNGSGKSTFINMLAGTLEPTHGHCLVHVRTARLDQQLGSLDPELSLLDQMPTSDEATLRMQLAQLDLDSARITTPTGQLSGGERLKAALAKVIHTHPPAQLLILDEPTNHLDLPSLKALEIMLNAWPAALLIVSHDSAFLNQLNLTHRLDTRTWQLDPWSDFSTDV